MLQIIFVKSYGVYFAGDIASFPKTEARKLVEMGAAMFVEADPEEAPPPSAGPLQRAPEVEVEKRPFPELRGRRSKKRELSATEEAIGDDE